MAKNFQEKIDELGIDAYGIMEKKFEWKYVFNYVLDWKDRKAINLPAWLKAQVEEVNGLDLLADQLKRENEVLTAVNIQGWVNQNIHYIGDMNVWKVEEKWQKAVETYTLRTGDCEDGAILFFVLCRKAGIPANRVRIVAGDVKGGGHCWAEFLVAPFAYCMDWCYWAELTEFQYRKPYIIGAGNYKKIWFMCNDEKAYGAFLKTR